MNKEIFISHRSLDKDYADLIDEFLSKCGIPSNVIFCSSLPGNDINSNISTEIRSVLETTVIDVIILSNNYYNSPYCMNELGIIWFKKNSTKIAICLPEINEYTMQGFFNRDEKIRRLNARNDVEKIADIIKQKFPHQFIDSTSKLNKHIDKLMADYNYKIDNRKIESTPINESINTMEGRILINDFTDDELCIFKFIYDKQERYIPEDMIPINDWLRQNSYNKIIGLDSIRNLVDDKIMSTVTDIVNEYDRSYEVDVGSRVNIDSFRELIRLSKGCIDFIDGKIRKFRIAQKAVNSNTIDHLIQNNFTAIEILMVQYIIDSDKNTLMTGWQNIREIEGITAWQDINQINNLLSTKYENVINKFKLRKLIDVSQVTSYNNPKEYEIKPEIMDMIHNLNEKSKARIDTVIKENLDFGL